MVNLLALKFGIHIINIKMMLWQKIVVKYQFFSSREAVKVGNIEISFTAISKRHFDWAPTV